MAWFRQEKKPKEPPRKQTTIPEVCGSSATMQTRSVYRKEVEATSCLQRNAGYHFRLNARERFDILFDDKSYKESRRRSARAIRYSQIRASHEAVSATPKGSVF